MLEMVYTTVTWNRKVGLGTERDTTDIVIVSRRGLHTSVPRLAETRPRPTLMAEPVLDPEGFIPGQNVPVA